jgi:hypothetical protein
VHTAVLESDLNRYERIARCVVGLGMTIVYAMEWDIQIGKRRTYKDAASSREQVYKYILLLVRVMVELCENVTVHTASFGSHPVERTFANVKSRCHGKITAENFLRVA